MARVSIPLGKCEQLEVLFAYPNIPGNNEGLADTILHWFGMTLERDGLDKNMASIRTDGSAYILDLDGPSESQNQAYATRFPEILKIGWKAYENSIPRIKQDGKWDPDGTYQWRFFLTLGVGIVDYRSLQLFHYPPARLLNPLRDSMKDPVTERCRDLLIANGVEKNETRCYETRINSCPIAAPDDQGSGRNNRPFWRGLMPVEFFLDFQREMIKALLQPHPTCAGYTIPMIVYGGNPNLIFGGMWMGANKPAVIEILDRLKTPVLGSHHPYKFYFQIQDGEKSENDPAKYGVGRGETAVDRDNCEKAVPIMKADLAVVRWQVAMARDPSQDPWTVLEEAQAFWNAPEQQRTLCKLVRRHGSLLYQDFPDGTKFGFEISWDAAKALCEADTYPCTDR